MRILNNTNMVNVYKKKANKTSELLILFGSSRQKNLHTYLSYHILLFYLTIILQHNIYHNCIIDNLLFLNPFFFTYDYNLFTL